MKWSEYYPSTQVKCSNCYKLILKDQPYYQQSIYSGGGYGYANFCIICACQEMKEIVEHGKQFLKKIKMYTKVKE